MAPLVPSGRTGIAAIDGFLYAAPAIRGGQRPVALDRRDLIGEVLVLDVVPESSGVVACT